MQNILNFLTFETFISPSMLFVFYYIGALFVPIIGFVYAKKFYKYPKDIIDTTISSEDKMKIFILSVLLFIFIEILWRMMFEYLFAFLQIRDSLINN